ncbi:hypothetical protein MHYP_G00303770 [Metynnis hypsauchen]
MRPDLAAAQLVDVARAPVDHVQAEGGQARRGHAADLLRAGHAGVSLRLARALSGTRVSSEPLRRSAQTGGARAAVELLTQDRWSTHQIADVPRSAKTQDLPRAQGYLHDCYGRILDTHIHAAHMASNLQLSSYGQVVAQRPMVTDLLLSYVTICAV